MKLRIANRKIRGRRTCAANKVRFAAAGWPRPASRDRQPSLGRVRLQLMRVILPQISCRRSDGQMPMQFMIVDHGDRRRHAGSGARSTHNQKIPNPLARRPSPSRVAGPSLSPQAGRGASPARSLAPRSRGEGLR
jgi:hypothetical protein